MKSDNRAKGIYAENIASKYLSEIGYELLERNFAVKGAEIDIIAIKNSILSIIEVKARSSDEYGTPAEAVGFRKQTKIRHAATLYHQSNPLLEFEEFSFDIIEIDLNTESVNHIINAF